MTGDSGCKVAKRKRSAKKGDVIVLDGERLFVRERDRSVLSPNLGLLVCPADSWAAGDDSGSRWMRSDDYVIEEPRDG